MDYEDVVKILDIWKERFRDIRNFDTSWSPHYRNGKRVLSLMKDLVAFLHEKEPALRDWMMTYLEANREEVFICWWGDHVAKWAEDQITENFPRNHPLHPKAQTEWDAIIGTTSAASFALASRMVEKYRQMKDFKTCDDETIVIIHKDKECNGDEWDCYLCDESEILWKKERLRRIQHCNHPLLNEECRKKYVWRHRGKHPELVTWEPLHYWGTIYRTTAGHSYETIQCYNAEEYKDYIRTQRKEAYGKGGTPKQAIEEFLSQVSHYGGWDLRDYRPNKTKFETFCQLWDSLNRLDLGREFDIHRIAEIEAMF